MSETTVTAVIERLEYKCAVFSVVDADDVAIVLKAYKELKAELAAVTAKRDAVPVNAIIAYYRLSEASDDALAFWEDNQRPFELAEDALNVWIKAMKAETQVTP